MFVVEVMHKTSTQYNAVIRKARQEKDNIALSDDRNHDLVKRIRCRRYNVSSVVDGQSSAADISNMFASKYHELYTSVTYDNVDMTDIRDELNSSIRTG